MISFANLTKQVHILNDIILTDMVYDAGDTADTVTSFSQHLLATKYWFSRISWANKKRYVLALLEDVRSAWTLSLLLKSMWNCRPKDAVLSMSEKPMWSSYDQVPLDHNRTAMPIGTLAQVMKNERMWFLTLESEAQAMVLCELLTIAGGPVMWAVLRRAQVLYERYRELQMQNLLECSVVNDQAKMAELQTTAQLKTTLEKGKKETSSQKASALIADPSKQIQQQPIRHAQKELDANLAVWNATIKSLRDRQKLEDLEMTFNDGSKKKIWVVNRPKPEAIETVDFLQLLPSSIGKRVLSYIPREQLKEYARVNKYWAYLVEELQAELTARHKINMDFQKLNDTMLRHDICLELAEQIDFPILPSSTGNISNPLSMKLRPPASLKASEKSAGVYSMRLFLSVNANKAKLTQKPIRNLADQSERLEQRGAADENLWSWCESILRQVRPIKKKVGSEKEEGVLPLGNAHFPCPMMNHVLKVPLKTPLYKDPSMIAPVKQRKNIANAKMVSAPKEREKRYSLWARDFSGLYPVYKIPSYRSPL